MFPPDHFPGHEYIDGLPSIDADRTPTAQLYDMWCALPDPSADPYAYDQVGAFHRVQMGVSLGLLPQQQVEAEFARFREQPRVMIDFVRFWHNLLMAYPSIPPEQVEILWRDVLDGLRGDPVRHGYETAVFWWDMGRWGVLPTQDVRTDIQAAADALAALLPEVQDAAAVFVGGLPTRVVRRGPSDDIIMLSHFCLLANELGCEDTVSPIRAYLTRLLDEIDIPSTDAHVLAQLIGHIQRHETQGIAGTKARMCLVQRTDTDDLDVVRQAVMKIFLSRDDEVPDARDLWKAMDTLGGVHDGAEILVQHYLSSGDVVSARRLFLDYQALIYARGSQEDVRWRWDIYWLLAGVHLHDHSEPVDHVWASPEAVNAVGTSANMLPYLASIARRLPPSHPFSLACKRKLEIGVRAFNKGKLPFGDGRQLLEALLHWRGGV